MRIRLIALLLCGLFGFAATSPVQAAVLPGSCQEIVNLQDDSEIDSSRIVEIDGATLKNPAAFRKMLVESKGKLPMIKGGDFSGWNFSSLSDAFIPLCFNGTNLKSTRWDQARFDGIGFIESDLEQASFRNASLQSILLREPHLKSVNMVGANLSDGWFDGGWDGSIEGWVADRASFRNFTISCGITLGDGCPMERNDVRFVGADFSGANVSTYPLWGQGDYSDALFEGTRFGPNQLLDLKNVQFSGVNHLVGGGEEADLDVTEVTALLEDALAANEMQDRASFDCAKAATPTEKAICGDYAQDIRQLDRQLANLYAMIRPKNPAIATSQKAWLAKRNTCTDRECLYPLYSDRVDELMVMMGEPEVIAKGTSALFVNEAVILSDSFRQTELFRKITPVLVGAASAEAVVSRENDGSYSIAGEAVGANAHLCSAGGDNLRFDPKNGWFSGRGQGPSKRRVAVFRALDDRIEFPGNGHPDEEQFPGSSDYVSCGARAVLPQLRLIGVDPMVIEQRGKALSEGY